MDGIIIVNKPQGWTSFDVVAKIRSLTKVKKVGHSGTLDPIATGVLPVFLGRATKFIKYFMEGDKGYETEMVLGARTDSGDSTGKFQTSNLKPQNEIIIPNFQTVKKALEKYRGEIEQTPPMFSAVKVNGQRLYELARKGIEVERKPRRINIYKLEITSSEAELVDSRRVEFYVECSKGTYVRQLVMDIGDDLGCGAYLTKISRVYSHPFRLSQAHDLEAIITLQKIGQLASIVIDPYEVLQAMGKKPA
ncbi:tRNA pseudouridine(55) synthase TruB [candidate division WOR-1 bacterium RIFOXYB2_FULL_48_7]|uniref:tRNA pseudouridine synthase B n=1 Tax=candidate division WOR-1 bacterium RIFOXYB2_FULL_48_7 TaxID=1802583 RepID=A0A1F4TR64_UNCSA|nr:MAG: tRNA pseudouridine(55) synthase TruB [candidate division WOR-1 bacterium RIFOXYB2_FULL_48_7]